MIRSAYLIESGRHDEDFRKGFLNKGYKFITKNMPNKLCVWKASEFYDDMLNPQGILIAVNYANSDEGKADKLWEQICDICEKNNIRDICSGEINVFPRPRRGFNIHTENDICFVYNVCRIIKKNEIGINSEIGVVLSGRHDERYLKYLSEKFNYIKIHHVNEAEACRIADELLRYNGTAVQVTGNLGELRSCESIFIFNQAYSDKMKYFSHKISIIDVFSSDSPLETHMYTNKLGEIMLNCSYLSFEFAYSDISAGPSRLVSVENFLNANSLI